MKKNVVGWNLLLFICGMTFVLMGLFIKELTYGSSVFAMGCAFIGASIGAFYKNFCWLKSENKPIYEEHLKNEKTNLNDERKIMLRQKSGQVTYNIMFVVLTILNIVFTFIGVEKWIIFTIWGVIVFKYICGVVIYYYLSKKM
ncbi:hypothetical protein LGL08_09885 [Clostridium estertheticum]|uniref:hypothetical protein n=1 Tax=Clostridium estertheticum TaxID=238834 RepID=UPI001CF2376B|nr:hypothetical protein [Clostridium estertheticum]MCB2307326.1 hypothetical protein [Clostridium estertheticum]MCB2344976.1 hypothetical protein [Clostridium estertheticum]MCB2349862.1 hypothetical protein [Clostridium estertheticum]WAG48213.1 hypothetical protein LL127_21410 [Clostridium estertheticum]